MKLIKMNTKLNLYSKFINNNNSSDCYDLVKNMRHRRILAKFRVGNHNLQIEKGRHTKPLTPRELRSCECCHSKNVEDECHFFLRQLKAWLFIRKRPPAKISRNLYSLLIKVLTRLKEIHCINCLTSLSTRKSSEVSRDISRLMTSHNVFLKMGNIYTPKFWKRLASKCLVQRCLPNSAF